jgi:hypothetical protein
MCRDGPLRYVLTSPLAPAACNSLRPKSVGRISNLAQLDGRLAK